MGVFWRAFAGAWAGKLFAAVFVAMLVALGFDIGGVGTWLVEDLHTYLTPTVGRYGFLGLAVVVFLTSFVLPIVREILSGSARRDMNGREVVDWIAYKSGWGFKTYTKYNRFIFVWDLAVDEFSKGAADGRIAVRGRPSAGGQHFAIERDYWQSARLHRDDLSVGRTPGGMTESRFGSSIPVPIFRNLLIERSEVLKTWPRANWLFRLMCWSWVVLKQTYWWIEEWLKVSISALKKLVSRIE